MQRNFTPHIFNCYVPTEQIVGATMLPILAQIFHRQVQHFCINNNTDSSVSYKFSGKIKKTRQYVASVGSG